MSALPYVTSPGNIEKALRGIQTAGKPQRVNQDFVKTILRIPGGSGDQITAFLKKIGFSGADGAPTTIYDQFRNPALAGRAAAEALKNGYGALFVRNEYMYKLSDEELKGLIIQETGVGKDSNVVSLVLASIKGIKKFADWSEKPIASEPSSATLLDKPGSSFSIERSTGLGMNLSYTINLNLPATSDPAVFNAIFKSLRDNLLRDANETQN